ncbi:MAG: hypothetical protein Q9207_008332 [Kuettlingeria erythrocarpa]
MVAEAVQEREWRLSISSQDPGMDKFSSRAIKPVSVTSVITINWLVPARGPRGHFQNRRGQCCQNITKVMDGTVARRAAEQRSKKQLYGWNQVSSPDSRREVILSTP